MSQHIFELFCSPRFRVLAMPKRGAKKMRTLASQLWCLSENEDDERELRCHAGNTAPSVPCSICAQKVRDIELEAAALRDAAGLLEAQRATLTETVADLPWQVSESHTSTVWSAKVCCSFRWRTRFTDNANYRYFLDGRQQISSGTSTYVGMSSAVARL